MTGKAGFVVTGMDSTGNICTLEALKDEWLPTDLTDLVFKMVHKWHPRLVAVEKVLFSAVFENYWKEAMKNRGVHFRVEAIPTGNKEKEARVRGLSNYFAAGQIYFHPDQKALIQEFDQFGATDDYHMLDALSMGPKVWRKGVDTKWLTDIQQANDVIFSSESGRHPIGGY
jgi:predicted phage terminase large subunit-like protein